MGIILRFLNLSVEVMTSRFRLLHMKTSDIIGIIAKFT